VEKEILHHLREVVTGFRYGLRIVFFRAHADLDSPEGDLLEYGLTLVIGDIKAVEDCLIVASAQDWRSASIRSR